MLELRAQHAGVERLRLRRFELRFRLRDVGATDHADRILVARQLQRFLVGIDGVLKQAYLGILRAQQEIILGELGLRRQLGRFQIGDARLRGRFASLDGATHASPKVELPVDIERDVVAVAHRSAHAAAADVGAAADGGAAAAARRAGVASDYRKKRSLRLLRQRARFAHARFRGLDRLIADLDLSEQRIELRVVEYRPPVAARLVVPRLRCLPTLRFLVCRGRLDSGAHIVGPERAPGERDDGGADRGSASGAVRRSGVRGRHVHG
jgi:hypothetical protein